MRNFNENIETKMFSAEEPKLPIFPSYVWPLIHFIQHTPELQDFFHYEDFFDNDSSDKLTFLQLLCDYVEKSNSEYLKDHLGDLIIAICQNSYWKTTLNYELFDFVQLFFSIQRYQTSNNNKQTNAEHNSLSKEEANKRILAESLSPLHFFIAYEIEGTCECGLKHSSDQELQVIYMNYKDCCKDKIFHLKEIEDFNHIITCSCGKTAILNKITNNPRKDYILYSITMTEKDEVKVGTLFEHIDSHNYEKNYAALFGAFIITNENRTFYIALLDSMIRIYEDDPLKYTPVKKTRNNINSFFKKMVIINAIIILKTLKD